MKIIFMPASQIGNSGDQLINLATLTNVRKHGVVVINDANTPEWFIEGIGAKDDERFSRYRSGRFYSSFMHLLISNKFCGPEEKYSLIIPPGHSSRRGVKEAMTAASWYVKLGIFKALGCKVIRAGFSIGPFDRLNALVESFGSRCFSYYGLRDNESMSIASKYRFRNVSYFPDLAWSFKPIRFNGSAEFPTDVVVSFRSNAYGTNHDAEYLAPIQNSLIRLVKETSLAGGAVKVCYQVESDAEAARQLCCALSDAGLNSSLIDHKLTISEAVAVYGSARVVISNRLHVLLLAAQSGTLPIPLANGNDNVKITSILRDNDLSDLILNLDNDVSENVFQLAELLGKRDALLEKIGNISDRNKVLIEALFRKVFL